MIGPDYAQMTDEDSDALTAYGFGLYDIDFSDVSAEDYEALMVFIKQRLKQKKLKQKKLEK